MPNPAHTAFQRENKVLGGAYTEGKFHCAGWDNTDMLIVMEIASRSGHKPQFPTQLLRPHILRFPVCTVVNLYPVQIGKVHPFGVFGDITSGAEGVSVGHKSADLVHSLAHLLRRDLA